MTPKKILIVDDDQLIANVYTNRFRLDGYEAEIVGTGEDAVEILSRWTPDIVILDLALPGMSGVQVIEHIRSRPETQGTPILVLSNNHLSSLIQAAWKAGATKCLSKLHSTPLQVEELIRKTLGICKEPPATEPAGEPEASPATADVSTATAQLENVAASSDVDFQIKLVETFTVNAPRMLAAMRSRHQAVARSENPTARLEELRELERQTRFFADAASLVGYRKIAQIASVQEALLEELRCRPQDVSSSAIRTIAQALDVLATLVNRAGSLQGDAQDLPLILVVEDETASRANIFYALQRAGLRAIGLDDSSLALRVLEQNVFDLIFLDMEMPGISGTEICERLRKTDVNRATPVVFIAANADFENRARSARSGGSDLIGKPLLLLELALKALTWLFRDEGKC